MKNFNLINYIIESYKNFFLEIDDLNFCANIFTTRDSSNFLEINLSNVNLLTFLNFLESDSIFAFNQLLDLFSIDYPSNLNRFQLNYIFLSTELNLRLRITSALQLNHYAYSISSVFKSANWLEREIWDMHGIPFLGHPDLRRILTNYGFSSFPLRKDFPLSGFTEIRYDDELKMVVEEPLALTQEFRYFDFLSPWQQPSNSK
jgi:NADH-quinone oxidoreductase subunit C